MHRLSWTEMRKIPEVEREIFTLASTDLFSVASLEMSSDVLSRCTMTELRELMKLIGTGYDPKFGLAEYNLRTPHALQLTHKTPRNARKMCLSSET